MHEYDSRWDRRVKPWFSQVNSELEEARDLLNRITLSERPSSSEVITDELTCPITLAVMKDPVMAADGITYERAAIETVIQHAPPGSMAKSPKTNLPLESHSLAENVNIRSLC
uniref:U-box domain-containing protein n=1 Tax=Grammatophora oceanica TaxID=210454 RepID=A0A7S1Y301_9STRA|mmetsp:Transcript_156/g.201  ORF Transcript_156/g.201 Transcript_156/m.201 type:complete len:113 (+) Transcript_156:459-797(+)